MPIYSFACQKCGHKQDHLMKMNESINLCPHCQSQHYEKQLTSASFSIKGDGQKTPCGADTREIKDIGCGGGCACHPH